MKARTAARKLEAKRLSRLREPNGRLSRRQDSMQARTAEQERHVKETVMEARVRVLGLSVAECDRPEAGSVLGRLYLDKQNNISEAMYIAGIRMADDYLRYCRLIGFPLPTPQALDITGRARIRDPEAHKPKEGEVKTVVRDLQADVERATKRYMAIERVLGAVDQSGRPVTSVCKMVCIRDEDIYHRHMIEFLKRGLKALANHYGIEA